jgi:hypothetical protein
MDALSTTYRQRVLVCCPSQRHNFSGSGRLFECVSELVETIQYVLIESQVCSFQCNSLIILDCSNFEYCFDSLV